MSIYGPSWASGDQITRTKQANMVSDEINTTDDIHPQYSHGLYYDYAVVHRVTQRVAGAPGTRSYWLAEGDNVTEAVGNSVIDIPGTGTGIKAFIKHSFKILPSMPNTNMTFVFKAQKSINDANLFIQVFLDINGVNVYNAAAFAITTALLTYTFDSTDDSNFELSNHSPGDIVSIMATVNNNNVGVNSWTKAKHISVTFA